MRTAKEKLQDVLASNPAVIYSLKLDGDNVIAVWTSDNVRTLLGYDPADNLDARWWMANVHADDRQAAAKQIPDLIEHGHLISEYRFRHMPEIIAGFATKYA